AHAQHPSCTAPRRRSSGLRPHDARRVQVAAALRPMTQTPRAACTTPPQHKHPQHGPRCVPARHFHSRPMLELAAGPKHMHAPITPSRVQSMCGTAAHTPPQAPRRARGWAAAGKGATRMAQVHPCVTSPWPVKGCSTSTFQSQITSNRSQRQQIALADICHPKPPTLHQANQHNHDPGISLPPSRRPAATLSRRNNHCPQVRLDGRRHT
ncbi:hypothetical protein COO60DRAFT_1549307, partial [Scenedesmus sp. NREL 46B-D3]